MTKTIEMTGKRWMQMIEANKDDAAAATAIEEVNAALNSYRESIAHLYGSEEALIMAVANKTIAINLTIG